MHEAIARTLYYSQVHLLFASLIGIVALALTSIRGGSATTKYWIWVAASLNFFAPTGALVDKLFAAHLSWASPLQAVGDVANIISRGTAASVLAAIWLLGTTSMFLRLCFRIHSERQGLVAISVHEAVQSAQSFLFCGIPVRFADSRQNPVVNGVLRPYICLPCGIDQWLSAPELNAVLIHELTHARRRDNLIRLLFEIGLCGLWFHPLVWVARSRLALYRELSCDESVIENANGGDLLSALAKFASPGADLLLQAKAASVLSDRIARLSAAQPQRMRLAVNALLALAFSAALLTGIFGTVAHTACCWVARQTPAKTASTPFRAVITKQELYGIAPRQSC